jgi:thiamine biosynthesis lipoprotein
MPAAASLVPLLALAAAPAEAPTFQFHLDHVLGTSFDMAVAAPRAEEAQFAFAAARAEIARLDAVLSGWRDDSELAALNRSPGGRASPDLFAVVEACETWRERTGGAFSARLGEVERIWTRADRTPDPAALCDAAGRAAAAPLVLDRARRTIDRPDGLTLAVDGLAKGYVVDAALAAARRAAPCAQAVMIDLGGDVACWGERGWAVGIADPARPHDNAAPIERVRLSNQALAVSGPGARDRTIGDQAYSHLLDPGAGWPAPRRQAAVVARSAAEADALATALAVMEPEAGVKLAAGLPDVEAMILARDGRRWSTPGWTGQSCQAPAPLPAGFAAEVSFEFPKVEAAGYRKPYAVVWVTDADKKLVKTLLILGAKPAYQPENYVWWRRYGRMQSGLDAMARPTRAPGRYSVTWDGTDEAGQRAPQGHYIIHVEAAREHGGHAYQSVEVDLGGAPAQADAAGKDELGTAHVRYAKRQ